MPNPNYVKGRRKEYKIANREKALGNIAVRTAGSHSPFDVISINPDRKIIKLIQSKPNEMSDKQKGKLHKENIKLNGTFEVFFMVL